MQQPEIRRLAYVQHAHRSVYCVGGRFHLTITDPLHHYSGDAHALALAECDCGRPASTREGEADNGSTQETQGEGAAD